MKLQKPSISVECFHLIRSFDMDGLFTKTETLDYAIELNEAIDKKLKRELDSIFKD